MKKISATKLKILNTALELFNDNDTFSITTNHIAIKAKLSTGNLYYHYKNKEEIIVEIYLMMSEEFESFNSFDLILSSSNPLEVLSMMYDNYGELFLKYKFLIRDIGGLLALYPLLKSEFLQRQEKRLLQIQGIFQYFIQLEIIEVTIDEIELRSKLNWFISSYWQLFSSTMGEVSKMSIEESKLIVFKILLYPILTPKGKELYHQLRV